MPAGAAAKTPPLHRQGTADSDFGKRSVRQAMQDGASGAVASVSGAAKKLNLLVRRGSSGSGKLKGGESASPVPKDASPVPRRGLESNEGTPNSAQPSRDPEPPPRGLIGSTTSSVCSSHTAGGGGGSPPPNDPVRPDPPPADNVQSTPPSHTSRPDGASPPRAFRGPFLSVEADTRIEDVFAEQPDFVAKLGSHFSAMSELRQSGVQFVPTVELPVGTTLTACWRKLLSGKSSFIARWHAGHGEREQSGEPLKNIPRWTGGELPGPLWREFECLTQVQAPWSMITKFTERHRLIAVQYPDGARDLVLHVSAQTPDVMYGSTFRCEALVRFHEAESGGVVSLDIAGQVQMLKSTVMRGKITSTGNAGLKESYVEFARLAQEELSGSRRAAAATPNETPVTPAAAPAPPAPSKPPPRPGVLSVIVVGVAFVLTVTLYLRASAAAESLGLVADAVAAAAAVTRAGGNSTGEIAKMLGPTQAGVRQIVSSTAGIALWSCCASAVASASIVLAQVRNIQK
eukprot:Hpha_TRINITY_DN8812_c0_g1::TRINITY_DN8812_c0_g1_i1::g.141467::m.141467